MPLLFKSPAREDTTASGIRAQGGGWASARAILPIPLKDTLAIVRDQTTLKNPKESEVEVEHEKRPGLLDFQKVDITIHPFPLISVDWTEHWAYRVTQGTEEAPEAVLIAYQKTAGTGHIKHFCGTIWLRAEDKDKTDFAVYEETEAYRRTPEAIARGHEGTIRTIKERFAELKLRPAQTAKQD